MVSFTDESLKVLICIPMPVKPCAVCDWSPLPGMLPLTRPVEDGDVVSGELVLAAHPDKQGAASPAGRQGVRAQGAPRFIRPKGATVLQHSTELG